MKKLTIILCVLLTLSLAAFACSGDEKDDTPTKSEFTWTGIEDTTVVKGDDTDVMQGITVKNLKDEDITSKVVILNEDEHEAELTALGVWDDFLDFNHNNAGVYTVYYMVTDDNRTETKSREITVRQGHNLGYGDFAGHNQAGFFDWTFDAPGGTGKVEKQTESDGSVKPKIVMSDTGNGWWSIQYINKVNLTEGESYRITIRAKSESGKAVAFGFEDIDNGYAMLQGLTVHQLTKEFKTFETYYKANATYTNAKAVLYLGKMLPTDAGEHTVILDRINIEKVEKCEEVQFSGLTALTLKSSQFEDLDLMEGVTAQNGEQDLTSKIEVIGEVPQTVTEDARHAVIYAIKNDNGPMAFAVRTVRVNVYKQFAYDVANGSFSQGLDYWVKDVNAQNAGEANFGVDENGAKITIVKPSSAGWHIQLFQEVTFTANTNYIIKVRAKASLSRSIVFELRAATQYPMALTTEFKDFEFAYTSKTAGSAKVSFLMGGGGAANINSIINIQSVKIELDADQTQYLPYQLINSDFEHGMKSWATEGDAATFSDNMDGTINVAFSANTGANWNIQLRQDGLAFVAGQKYRVIVEAKSTVARTITVETVYLADKTKLNAASNFSLTTEMTVFSYEFTPGTSLNDVRVGMLLGGSAIKDTAVTISKFKVIMVTE